MERFDPASAWQIQALVDPDWMPSELARRDTGFGERAIGELVRAIVARLGEENSRSAGEI